MKILFRRDYRRYQGGHLKVFDYYQHCVALGHEAHIYLTPESIQDESLDWSQCQIVDQWSPEEYDVLFLEGRDWEQIGYRKEQMERYQIINLIQGPSHADPKEKKFNYLEFKAHRICVSEFVRQKILNTGRVNGPVFTIPNGIKQPAELNHKKKRQILILGQKKRELAKKLRNSLLIKYLFRYSIKTLIWPVAAEEFLEAISRAEITICLPLEEEGFYLPALEAMSRNSLVICPDVGGNMEFCVHKKNCMIATYSIQGFKDALLELDQLSKEKKNDIKAHALDTSRHYHLQREQTMFEQILNQLN